MHLEIHRFAERWIYYLKISADMCKQGLCRSLVVQVCKGLFGKALVGSPALKAP